MMFILIFIYNMKKEIIILGITAFLIFNIYHDGKYTKMLFKWKKYYNMIFIGILGIGIYLLMKKNPKDCKLMLHNANNFIKYLPIDKSSLDMISPILDFTANEAGYTNETHTGKFMNSYMNNMNLSGGEKKILTSGKQSNKRSVSETKKKYVASMQNWKCGNCNNQLTAWFEVDHKTRLADNGGNDVSNLIALCRECHGKKTAMENM